MRMNCVLRHGDSCLLEPIQQPVQGWSIRPGTFRVAQPYDGSSHGYEISSTPSGGIATLTESTSPSRKKQKLSRQTTGGAAGPDAETVQWIQAEFRALMDQDAAQSLLDRMPDDYFYGTCVDAPPSDTFALDLVKLRPTLRMLKSGFKSTSDSSIDGEEGEVIFDKIELGSGFQLLDLGDVYQTLIINHSSEPTLISFPMEGQPQYLIPPRSGFVASDLDRIHGLKSIAQKRGGFDIIVMDPPWKNASVDRMAHYGTLDLYDLFKIPIPDLLGTPKKDSRGIVAVWITNRAKVKRMVVEKLFSVWGLELVAHWFWLKVTTKGEPVLNFDNMHRRAYEGILIGQQKEDTSNSTSSSTVKRQLLVSVPSQHSRKPSLNALLEQEFFGSRCVQTENEALHPDSSTNAASTVETRKPLQQLELFARNLEEGVLSWGNEPIRHQYCGRGSNGSSFVQDGFLVPSPSSVLQSSYAC
ncbi:Methyltransferase-like protein 4 [Mortierella claussenii]|nr:Methyltransferase-like protein 4 [Mortierella claussenii]